ncbi:MAG: hypothetical protein GX568_03445 [Candidatus Gastranaerophilales bacterium]|nr:hypothetical protein [Candidatus Gastranaerophilales bacterium]
MNAVSLAKTAVKQSASLISASKKLLPGCQPRTLAKLEQMAPDNLVLVHMTNYFPHNGIIKSTREATKDANGVGRCRDTVHFAMNHAVYEHQYGNPWNSMKYAILAPLNGVMKSNKKENIVGGAITDFFIKKSVKLPEGSVIVRHNPDVPKGKLKVLNAGMIEELKDTKGLTVLETSGNVKETANNAVEMMGYTRIDKMIHKMMGITEEQKELMTAINNPQTAAKIMEESPEKLDLLDNINYEKITKTGEKASKAFQKFADKNEFKNYPLHSTSPYWRSEMLIEDIKILLGHENNWEHTMKGGLITSAGEKVNYKKEFLDVIPDIKASLGEGESLTYDIDKLGIIIKEAETPKDALKQVEKQLKLKPMKSLEECMASGEKPGPDELYMAIDTFTGISPVQKDMFSYINKSQF